jgi:hypothetical protein
MRRPIYRVAREHRASFAFAMVAAEGDRVSIGRKDPEMPGWFWCRDSRGLEMWVPSTHLNIGEGKGIFNQPYNSVELNVAVGDMIQFLGEALGWVECLDVAWRYGWVPADKLIPV